MKLQITRPLKELIKAVVPRPMLNWAILKSRAVRNNFRTKVAPDIVEEPVEKTVVTAQTAKMQFLSIDWLNDNLKDAVAKKEISYFLSQDPDSLISICATESNYLSMAECIFEIASLNELSVEYLKGKNYQSLNFQDAFRDTVKSEAIVLIRLSDGARRIRFRIEKWNKRAWELAAPRPFHMTTHRISTHDPKAIKNFLNTPGIDLTALFDRPMEDSVDFDIDVVYTWVNSDDPDWAKIYAQHKPDSTPSLGDAVSMDRFVSRQELKYSLRSIAEFAPWVRRIFIVSNCKPPEWLNVDDEHIVWVPHTDIIEEQYLPTFSSHAIESALHNIPGLAEHFVYFNDDVFLAQQISPLQFFLPNGLAKIRLEPYGTVHGKAFKDDADFMNAARNGQALLQERFGKTATQLHTHAPFALTKSIMANAEKDFKEPWSSTRGRRFRSEMDVSPTSFLSPHYAYLSGAAIKCKDTAKLIKRNNTNYKRILDDLLANRRENADAKLPITYCINDGGGSHEDPEWNAKCIKFMDAYFPLSSKYEVKF